jgi:cell division protein ZapD
MLRESGRRAENIAEQGTYQQMLGGKLHQLLQVWVDGSNGVFPEISGNRHMVWIRFSVQQGELKPYQVSQDVDFQMSLCGT